jgi:hypothetical protein
MEKTLVAITKRLHELDVMLTRIAAQRRDSADFPEVARDLEAVWREQDEERQQCRRRATDAELIQYELERHVRQTECDCAKPKASYTLE